MIRVLIADDHPLIREGLRTLLQDEADMKVTAEASNGLEVLRCVEQDVVDVMVLDISLPDGNGIDVLKELRRRQYKVPVLFLTLHAEERYALRAFKAGGAGYLTKECASEELVKAIRKVASGRRYISERFAENLNLDLESRREGHLHETLSDREYQVFCLIASGKRVHDIAETLGLSEATIYTYRERIVEKTRLNSVAEFTRYALENRLID